MSANEAQRQELGLWSGVGLCIASMVGSGVFLSSGFMAQDMSAGPILLAWVVGALLAMLGARAYAALAMELPRSGGEYRYLSELAHPALGYVAGWVTIFIGFSQPTAINARAAADFLGTLIDVPTPRIVAALAILLVAGGHALGHTSSRWLQNLLVAAKVLLLLGFAAMGVAKGSHQWPEWTPPNEAPLLSTFVGSLFYIGYAFSGWNTAAYAAEEFRHPRRDVARAMLIGCALVAVFYMLVNWIFVANLVPSDASAIFGSKTSTLGHVVSERLVGDSGARLMSVLAVMAFVSAMSAMLMIGPRITDSMARDGYLPAVLQAQPGRPPVAALSLQVAFALVVVSLQDLQEALSSVGATLILFSALTTSSLLYAHHRGRLQRKLSIPVYLSTAAYSLSAFWMLSFAFRNQPKLLPWLGGIIATALLAYAITRKRTQASNNAAGEPAASSDRRF